MLSHKKNVEFQAKEHTLITTSNFSTKELYISHLIHEAAYYKAAEFAKGKKVLDLGCNTGYGSNILSQTAKNVIGVDVSNQAVETAKKEFKNNIVSFQQIDGERLPFDNNEFDIIVSFQVIEHIVDYSKYIGEIKRVLSPKGIVLFTTPNALIRLDHRMKPWYPFHVYEFNNIELESLLNNYYSNVCVFGLFAIEPLHSIELNRCNIARIQAKKILRSRIKKMIPLSIQEIIRKIINKVLSKPIIQIEQEFIEKYSYRDFFYLDDKFETALDLLALCSDNEEELNSIIKQLKKN